MDTSAFRFQRHLFTVTVTLNTEQSQVIINVDTCKNLNNKCAMIYTDGSAAWHLRSAWAVITCSEAEQSRKPVVPARLWPAAWRWRWWQRWKDLLAGIAGLHLCLCAEWLNEDDLKGSDRTNVQAVAGVLAEVKGSQCHLYFYTWSCWCPRQLENWPSDWFGHHKRWPTYRLYRYC